MGGERERIQEAGSFFNVSPDIVDRFLRLLSIRKIRRTNSEKSVERFFHSGGMRAARRLINMSLLFRRSSSAGLKPCSKRDIYRGKNREISLYVLFSRGRLQLLSILCYYDHNAVRCILKFRFLSDTFVIFAQPILQLRFFFQPSFPR